VIAGSDTFKGIIENILQLLLFDTVVNELDDVIVNFVGVSRYSYPQLVNILLYCVLHLR